MVVNVVDGDNVLKEVGRLGIKTTLKTIQRYEIAQLIPEAKRNSGPGFFGKETEYSPDAVYQFCASYSLVHAFTWKVKFENVSKVREAAVQIMESVWTYQSLIEYVEEHDDKIEAVWRWILNFKKAQHGIPINEKYGIQCYLSPRQTLEVELRPLKDLGGMIIRIG